MSSHFCRAPAMLLAMFTGMVLADSAWADVPSKPTNVELRVGETPIVAKLMAIDPASKTGFALVPSGEIATGPLEAMAPTDKPFKPSTFDELASELTTKAFPGFKSHKTTRYLYIYNCSDEFRKLTSTILETMYPSLFAYFKNERFDVHQPEFPLVIVIFAHHTQMRGYKPNLPENVVAFYETLSNRVILTEKSRLVEQLPQLGIQQAFSTIAHEGVHQILHNIGVQARLSRWPAWLSEGMAEYFSPTEVGQRMRWKGVGKPNDLRMMELAQLPAPVEKSGEKTITERTVSAGGLTSTGYATAWALTNYLGERHRPSFLAYVRDVSGMKPLEAVDPDQEIVRFRKHFGEDMFKIDQGVHTHISKLKK